MNFSARIVAGVSSVGRPSSSMIHPPNPVRNGMKKNGSV